MKRTAVVFCRMSSSRLPAKALLPLGNHSLIETVISNLRGSTVFDVVLATSDETSDDPLEKIGYKCGIEVFRGHLADVAKRTSDCLRTLGISMFARVNGDSPFVNKAFIEKGFYLLEENECDFVTNVCPRSFPYGYSLEVFKSCVFLNGIERFDNRQREHITSFFYENSSQFRYINLQSDFQYPAKLSLTIDDESSYSLIKRMADIDPLLFQKSLPEIAKVFFQCN